MSAAEGLDEGDPVARAVSATRALVAENRAAAARDRQRPAHDREAAARDREMFEGEILRSHTDETGAYAKRTGELLLRHEIGRAQHAGSSLTLGVIGLGSAVPGELDFENPVEILLLTEAVSALRRALHPYDPIVRWAKGGFICTMGGVEPQEARRRLIEALASITRENPTTPITIGLVGLESGDSLAALIERPVWGLNGRSLRGR